MRGVRGARIIAIVVALWSTAAAGQSVDSLTKLLASPKVRVRGAAVISLGGFAPSALPSTTRTAVIALLEREALGLNTPVESPPPEDADESWGEYVGALSDLAVSIGDASAIRGVALLGIQTSQGAQNFIASFGAQSLAALDEAWSTKPDARPSVVATWGVMLAPGLAAVDSATRAAIIVRILAADDTFPIAIATAARNGQLSVLVPLLDVIASTATDSSVIFSLQYASAALTPAFNSASTTQLLQQVGFWLGAVCANPHWSLNGYCNSEQNRLNDAIKQIGMGHNGPATNILNSFISKTLSAAASGALSPLASQTIVANAQRVIAKLGS